MSRGLTLIELLVLLSIIGIALGLAGLAYKDWRVRWGIEADTKNIYALVQKARAMAFSRKMALQVVASGKQVCISNGASNLECVVLDNRFSGTILITDRGILSNSSVVYSGSYTGSPAYNCVVSSPTRVRMGVYDGTSCVPK